VTRQAEGELTGVGLRGMRERVRQFGGHLDVRSNGHGTRVMAVLPIPNVPDEADKNTRSMLSKTR
jgi:signal transduction histidine kinase